MSENCKRNWHQKNQRLLIKETVIKIKFLSLRILYTSGEICKRL